MKLLLIFYNILYAIIFLPVMLVGYIPALLRGGAFHYFERFGFLLPASDSDVPSIWLHAASVGEVKSLGHLVNVLRQEYKGYRIIISVMTKGGYEMAGRMIYPDAVFLLPVENRWAILRLARGFNVKLFAITDTELWPGLISTLSGLVPLMLINARISDKSFKSYQRFDFIFKHILAQFSAIVAKSAADAERFITLAGSGDNVMVGGNIKYIFDISAPNANVANKFRQRSIALAASTHEPEEALFLEAVKACDRAFDSLVIIPRHVKRAKHICKQAKKAGFDAAVLSEGADSNVVVVDSLGLVESFYQIAEKIFVGGSLNSTGGHNIFEALKYKKKLAIGPNMQNFADIAALAHEHGLATEVRDVPDLAAWLDKDDAPVDFDSFFEALDRHQKDRFNALLESIDKCIKS